MTSSRVVFTAGTRASSLARTQTAAALKRIESLLPALTFEAAVSSSPGDRDRQTDLRVSPGDFFTQDLDRDVLSGKLDCAVHSAKDLPNPVTEGLDWCWLPWRADPRDAVILRVGESRADLPAAPKIGVSSDRREAWCRSSFPGCDMQPIRGNIEDRLAQLDDGAFDVVIMAAAALQRLELADRITEWIPLSELEVPAGQGVLAMTFRMGDERFTRLRSLFVKPVVFVGASVGQADFCTVAGVDALSQCDVCLHDTLMDRALLGHLPAHATCIDVGKRSGAHTVPQDETIRLIKEYARRGLRVVRLKGGDPCIFGRLAEEAEALDALHLPYRVIPGISSLSVMGASTGILLTRRGVANGFTVMSGRGRGGVVSDVSAEKRSNLPIVLFMSLSVLPELLDQLRASGVEDNIPAAVVLEAGSSNEEVLRGTVASIGELLAERLQQSEAKPAGLVVVGDVAGYAFSHESGALQGQRVLLTCSDALQPEARRCVASMGGIPVSLPLIQLVPEPAGSAVVTRCSEFDWLVVTSPSAVRCLVAGLRTHDVDIRSLPRILACGPGTIRELRAVGIVPDASPDRAFGADGVLRAAKACIEAGSRVLRVRSDRAGAALSDALRAFCAEVEDVCLYRNEPCSVASLPTHDTVFFASSSAVSAFAERWGVQALHDHGVLAIGVPTAKALAERGIKDVLVSPEATVEHAIACLAAHEVNRRMTGSG